jgi:hypothetical protein
MIDDIISTCFPDVNFPADALLHRTKKKAGTFVRPAAAIVDTGNQLTVISMTAEAIFDTGSELLTHQYYSRDVFKYLISSMH